MSSLNYVNPVCCVATVCHQVCCICWGHLGHFHRAIYRLKWYKIVCMRYLGCTFSQMKSINMFSMYLRFAIWSSQTFSLEMYCSLNIEPHCFHVYVCQCWPQTLAAICRTMGYSECFHAASNGKIYLGFEELIEERFFCTGNSIIISISACWLIESKWCIHTSVN